MTELPPSWMTGCYSPQGDRLMLGNLVCTEGVADVAGGSLLVSSGGSGLDVSVAQGGCWVEGDDDDRGVYSCYNDAPVTRTATANASGNPRIDTVVARVYDSTYGEGADEWKLEIIAGTPTGGATLTNLNGAASLVGLNAIPLAYVLVANGEVGPIDAADILDARDEFTSCGQPSMPYVDLRAAAPTSVGSGGTGTVIALATTLHNDANFYTVGTNTITVIKAGLYDVGWTIALNPGSPGAWVSSGVTLNGTTYSDMILKFEQGDDNWSYTVTTTVPGVSLAAGSILRLLAAQNIGSAKDASDGRLFVRKVG